VGWGRGWGRQVGRSACGCAPAFGRAVGPLARRVYGTAEAVPLRWVGGGEISGWMEDSVPEVSFVEGDAVLHQEGAEFFFK